MIFHVYACVGLDNKKAWLRQIGSFKAGAALQIRPTLKSPWRSEETEPWREGEETWRVLRAYFPGSIETHNLVQDFFFREDLMLRRHDYSVNIVGGFAAAQLTSDYVTANGIRLPTRRRAYPRGPDRRPILEMLMVSIDLSAVQFE